MDQATLFADLKVESDSNGPVRMQLGKLLYECPAAWINFINDLGQRNVPTEDDEGYSVGTINNELKLFGGTYLGNENRIEFETAGGYTYFLMVYGHSND